jgi:hypothetical protein
MTFSSDLLPSDPDVTAQPVRSLVSGEPMIGIADGFPCPLPQHDAGWRYCQASFSVKVEKVAYSAGDLGLVSLAARRGHEEYTKRKG